MIAPTVQLVLPATLLEIPPAGALLDACEALPEMCLPPVLPTPWCWTEGTICGEYGTCRRTAHLACPPATVTPPPEWAEGGRTR